MTPIFWLASNSPRRRALLSLAGWNFQVRAVDIDESPLPDEPAAAYVLRLAETKARAACAFAAPEDVILAADTTVADGDAILGKPADAYEARVMLRALRAREHSVYTALSVIDGGQQRQHSDRCLTRVWMRDYTDAEIDAYIASGDPFDKAGAYAIQHPTFQPVARLQGCYSCVVGLPVCRAAELLAQFGLLPSAAERLEDCRAAQQQDRPCRVYQDLLRSEATRFVG